MSNFLLFLIYFTVPIAIWLIQKKAGLSPWWALIALIPGGSLVWLWAFAFVQWRPARTSD